MRNSYCQNQEQHLRDAVLEHYERHGKYVALNFDNLSPQASYTLTAKASAGEEHIVFQEVPFEQFFGLSESLDSDLIDDYESILLE